MLSTPFLILLIFGGIFIWYLLSNPFDYQFLVYHHVMKCY